MAKISGIYVEIRGDSTQLRKDLATARQHVTEQATGMSNALNNALSPAQLKNNINGIVRDLNTLSQASKLTGKEFGAIGADLKDMQRLTGLSENAFRDLQSRMIQTSAAKAQETALRNIAKAANLSAKEVSQLGKQMGVSADGIAAVNGASRSASSSLSMLGTATQAALAYFSVQTVIEFSRAVLDAGIAMDSLQRSFVAVTGSQAGAAEALSFLREEAGRLGQNLYALAPEFKNVMAAARGTAMEGENVRKMFSAIAAASTALGLSADDTQGALRALQQMMSKGTIQAEELRGQLGERLPGALNLMAKAMGVSTADLNKMMEQGKLLADDALPKLTKEIERVYGAAAETAALESAQAAVNRLSQEWTEFKINLFDNDAAVNGINAITNALRTLTEYAGLRPVSDTFAQGAGLADKGLIDFDVFKSADFLERQRMVDQFLSTQKVAAQNFTATWAAAEQQSLVGYERYNERKTELSNAQSVSEREAIAKAAEEFRKLTQTEISKLDERRDAFLANGVDRAKVEAWYTGEVAKLNEKSTKKFVGEQKKQVDEHKKAREAMRKNESDTLSAVNKWMEDYEQLQIDAVSNGVAERKKLREDEAAAAIAAAQKIAEEQEAAAQKVMDRIQEGTADVFYDMFQDIGNGWETLWDSMKNWALRTLAELAARAATVNIVVPIMTSVTGTSDITGAVNSLTGGGDGFNLSSLSSLVNPGSMLSNVPGYSTVAGILGTQLPGTTLMSGGALALAGGGTAGGSVASLAAAQNLAGMTGGLSIGSALGTGGIGGLGYSLLGGSLGLPQNQYTGITSSLGGALGAWGGSALAGTAGAALGATAGSVVPIIGTAIGAVLGGLAGGLFSEDEMSPSVIFNAQSMEWGSTDSSRRANDGGNKRLGFEFHTKDGASSSTGVELATALEGVASTAFASIESTLSAFGDQYVDMLDGTVIEFGRKVSGAAGGSWDFGSDMDFEKLFAEYSGKLQGAILAAAEGAFNAAGRDIAGSEDATSALSMLAEKAATQFTELQSVIQAGVQSGDVNAYAAQIQSFQAIVQSITSAWDSVSQASAELVNPLTQYEQAQRSVNQQYDVWIAQLEAIGFASEKVAQIDADRVAVLGQLADQNRAAIDDVLQTSAQIATPLSDAAAAVQQVNNQFDSLVEQADALGADETALAQIERDRQTALANLAAATDDVVDTIIDDAVDLEKVLAELGKTFDGLASEIASGLKAMVAGARSALSTAYDSEREAIESALSATIDGLQGQIGGIDEQIDGRESAKSAWESVASSLKSAVSDIMPMSLTQAMSALDGYIRGAFAGQTPDEYGLSRAVGTATSIGTDAYGSRVDYERAQGQAAAKLATLASISDTRVSVEQQQLDALTSQREALDAQIALAESAGAAQLEALELTYQNALAQLGKLEGIEKYTGTMDDALGMIQSLTRQYGDIQAGLARAQATAALGTYDAMTKAVTILETIRDGMGGTDVPGFASGGYHSGGLRIVGENGPELEYTGPSRIWSADDTRSMLSGGSDGTAEEIRALRDDLRAQSAAMVAMQQKMNKLLGRWDYNGMPETRVVA